MMKSELRQESEKDYFDSYGGVVYSVYYSTAKENFCNKGKMFVLQGLITEKEIFDIGKVMVLC